MDSFNRIDAIGIRIMRVSKQGMLECLGCLGLEEKCFETVWTACTRKRQTPDSQLVLSALNLPRLNHLALASLHIIRLPLPLPRLSFSYYRHHSCYHYSVLTALALRIPRYLLICLHIGNSVFTGVLCTCVRRYITVLFMV